METDGELGGEAGVAIEIGIGIETAIGEGEIRVERMFRAGIRQGGDSSPLRNDSWCGSLSFSFV